MSRSRSYDQVAAGRQLWELFGQSAELLEGDYYWTKMCEPAAAYECGVLRIFPPHTGVESCESFRLFLIGGAQETPGRELLD